jgi:hypothetical protein
MLVSANAELRQVRSNHRTLAFVEVTTMEIGAQHKADWVGAGVRFEFRLHPKTLADKEAISSVEDFALEHCNRLLLADRPEVLD